MPGACRLADMCTGHDSYPPRPNVMASMDVFINGMGAHRVGDMWGPHCNNSCHTGTLAMGSTTVFINGMPAGRIGDPVDCGSTVMTGSMDVFIGG